MGFKKENLDKLLSSGWNIFPYKEFSNMEALKDWKEFCSSKEYTIRCDTNKKMSNLPFMQVLESTKEEDILMFINDNINKGYQLLFTDGKRFDNIQQCNIVVTFENYDIKIELSEEKIPLRKMYEHPENLTQLQGDFFKNLEDFKKSGKAPEETTIDEIEMVLCEVLKRKKESEHNFELTLYPVPVGVRESRIIVWQTL